MGREDTSGRWEAWGCQLSQEPHPEAGTSKSCLPRLATGGAGSPPEPLAGEGREGHTALHRADEPRQLGVEGTGGQGHLLLRGRHLQLVWPGVAWREGMAWQMKERNMARAPEPLPHANMVSCNHCRGGQTDESARDSRNVKSSLPARQGCMGPQQYGLAPAPGAPASLGTPAGMEALRASGKVTESRARVL